MIDSHIHPSRGNAHACSVIPVEKLGAKTTRTRSITCNQQATATRQQSVFGQKLCANTVGAARWNCFRFHMRAPVAADNSNIVSASKALHQLVSYELYGARVHVKWRVSDNAARDGGNHIITDLMLKVERDLMLGVGSVRKHAHASSKKRCLGVMIQTNGGGRRVTRLRN
jgi:hypothetical protein